MLLIYSCANIDLVLKKNDISNYKNNTELFFDGKIDQKSKEEFFSIFGNSNNSEYILIIRFSETKENRLVKKNQVAEKIDYKISIEYEFYYGDRSCRILTKEISTDFSLVQKSFGYNFGADALLDKLYRSNTRKNIYEFIDALPEINISSCL
jgi:hypothetical protein